MCGICGVAGKDIYDAEIKAFKDLLYITALRGDDSTGVFSVDHESKDGGRIKKLANDAGYYIWMDQHQKQSGPSIIKSFPNTLLMGHCRAATRGSVNESNAHPFDTGRYVSAHNGTLNDKEYDHASKTDSQMMFEAMETKGIDPVLEGLDAWSAYAIQMFCKDTRKLTLTRNEERPLFFAFDMSKNVMFWASELAFLKMIEIRHNRKFEIRQATAGTIYEFDISEIKAGNLTPYDTRMLSLPDKYGSWDWVEYRQYGQGGSTGWSKKDKSKSKTTKNEDADMTLWDGGEWRCDVCNETTQKKPTKIFADGQHKRFACRMCSEWIDHIDPMTGAIEVRKVKHDA